MSDPAAPHADVLAHAAFVRRLAWHLLHDDAAADDAAQEALARAMERPPREGPGIRGWFAAVVRNVVRRGRRGDARRERREHGAARPERAAGTDPARAEILRVVADAIASLERADREVVMLRHYEALPPRAIAERLGVTVEAVKSRLRRAHERLRARLDERRGGNVEGWRGALAVFAAPVAGPVVAEPPGFAEEGIVVGTATKVGIGVAAAAVAVAAIAFAPQGPSAGPGSGTDPAGEAPAAVAGTPPTPDVAPPTLARAGTTSPAPQAAGAVAPFAASASSGPAATPPATADGEVALADVIALNSELTPSDVVHVVALGPLAGDLEVGIAPDPSVGYAPEHLAQMTTRTIAFGGDGVAKFEGVARGAYRVKVRGPARAERSWGLTVPQLPQGNHRQPVVFGGASVAGRAFERTGAVAADRTVLLSNASQWGLLGAPLVVTSRTDGDGRWRFQGIHSGRYGVTVQYESSTGVVADHRTVSVELKPGAHIEVDLGSDRAEPTWSGTVVLRSGTRVRGPKGIHLDGVARVTAAIDVEGRFAQRMPPGAYHGSIPFPGRLESHLLQVTIGETDLSSEIVVLGVRVEGRVFDAASGESIPGTDWRTAPIVTLAAVGAEPRDWDRARPDAEGRFLFDGIPAGRHRLRVLPPRGAKGVGNETVVDVPEDADVRGLRLELRRE